MQHAGASQAPFSMLHRQGLQALLSDQEFCSKHKLPGPDKIVVQDWARPVRAPSKETKGLEPSPNPNWHSSGLDKSSLQTQTQLFKLGGIQLMRCLKKTKGLEPPPDPNWHPSGLDKSSLQSKSNCSRLEATSQGTVSRKLKAWATPKPKLAPLVLTSPASSKLLAPACSSQVRRTDKKTGARSEFERTLNP